MTARIQVVCTGRGSHRELEVGVLVDLRASQIDGASLLSLADDLGGEQGEDVRQMVGEAQRMPRGIYYVGERGYATEGGTWRRVQRPGLSVRVRADGGRTFDLTCRKCRNRSGRPLYLPQRDTSAERLFDSGASRLDISTVH